MYKRQALGWVGTHTPLVAPEAFLARILVGYLLIAAGLALGSFVLAQTGFRGYRFTPVSYTHLDVYKRQGLSYVGPGGSWSTSGR